MMEPYWAVAQTVPNREEAASERLRDLGIDVVLPMWKRSRKSHGKWKLYNEYVWPSYLFLMIVGTWRSALGRERVEKWVPRHEEDFQYIPSGCLRLAPATYVVRVVMDDAESPRPARVRPGHVEEISQIMQDHGGYMPATDVRRFISGQRVRVDDLQHSFYGNEGLYECRPSQGRARVLVDMLGRKVPVVFNERDLIAA